MRRFVRRNEQGVTIVEAAFVIPILFLFMFALIDIGLWEYQRTQASAAARDGARPPTSTAAGTTTASRTSTASASCSSP